MRRFTALVCAVVLFVGVLAVPAAAVDKLEVTIETVQDIFSGEGTFTINRDAAAYLCESGMLTSGDTTIIWLSEDTFKIWQDKILTPGTGKEFVLELTNTIVLGQGGLLIRHP